MFNITEMAEDVRDFYAGWMPPVPVYKDDFVKYVISAVKRLFVDRNRPAEFSKDSYSTDDDGNVFYDADFDIVQEEYIFILSKLNYKRKMFGEVSGDKAVSYTTDALSVTGAKEAYKSIQQEIADLEHDRLVVFHKMMANEGD